VLTTSQWLIRPLWVRIFTLLISLKRPNKTYFSGHKFLLDEFNYHPRVGWQIDPFGHSNTHAWLSSAVGFDALYFGRYENLFVLFYFVNVFMSVNEYLIFLGCDLCSTEPFWDLNNYLILSCFLFSIDYQDHNKRMDEKRMEMIWRGSNSDKDKNVFTGTFWLFSLTFVPVVWFEWLYWKSFLLCILTVFEHIFFTHFDPFPPF
jgi:hypothetical protein